MLLQKHYQLFVLVFCCCACNLSHDNKPPEAAHQPERVSERISVDSTSTPLFISYLMGLPETGRDSVFLWRLSELEKHNQFRQILTDWNTLKVDGLSYLSNNPSVKITIASAYQNLGKPDTALFLLNSITESLVQNNDLFTLGKAYRGIAATYQSMGDISNGVDYFYKSMEVFKKSNHYNEYYQSQIELATIFFSIKDFDKSLLLHRQAYYYFKSQQDTAQMAYTLDGITVALNNMDSLESAFSTGQESLNLYRQIGNLSGISVASNNLAHLCKRRGDLNAAEHYLREGLSMMEQSGEQRYIPVCLSNLGNCLLELNKLQDAEATLIRAENSLGKMNEFREVANIKLALSKVYQKTARFEKALMYRQEYEQLKDSLNSRAQMQIIAEAGQRYESKVKEAEIEHLKYEKTFFEIKLKVFIGGFLAFIALTGGWLYARYKRRAALLEKEKEILAEKSRTQEAQLKLAYSELASFAENIQEKTRLLDDLQMKFDINPEKMSDYLTDFYQQRILTEADWVRFKEQINLVYPGLFLKIRQHFPDISQAELRLLLLIRINLETREIAATLGVSPDTVKKTRQRLRRRLGLSEADKLEDMVRQL